MVINSRWGLQIQYGPLAVPLALGIAAGAATYGISSAMHSKASTMGATPAPTAAQTVDNTAVSNLNNAGRAALIMTSPQGVQGTDPTNRYALLGNQNGLGNQ